MVHKGSLFSHPYQLISACLFDSSHFNRCDVMSTVFFSLVFAWWLVRLSIFSCTCWGHCMCSSKIHLFRSFAPFFVNLDYFILLCYWVVRVPSMCWILFPYLICSLQIFLNIHLHIFKLSKIKMAPTSFSLSMTLLIFKLIYPNVFQKIDSIYQNKSKAGHRSIESFL